MQGSKSKSDQFTLLLNNSFHKGINELCIGIEVDLRTWLVLVDQAWRLVIALYLELLHVNHSFIRAKNGKHDHSSPCRARP